MTRVALALGAVTLGMIALAVCMAALAWSIPAPYTPDPRLDLLYGEVIDDLTGELERGRVALAAWEDALVRAREARPAARDNDEPMNTEASNGEELHS